MATTFGSYYDKELQRVLPEDDHEHSVMVKVVHDDKKTKWLAINLESIESLRAFLDIIEEDLKK